MKSTFYVCFSNYNRNFFDSVCKKRYVYLCVTSNIHAYKYFVLLFNNLVHGVMEMSPVVHMDTFDYFVV